MSRVVSTDNRNSQQLSNFTTIILYYCADWKAVKFHVHHVSLKREIKNNTGVIKNNTGSNCNTIYHRVTNTLQKWSKWSKQGIL